MFPAENILLKKHVRNRATRANRDSLSEHSIRTCRQSLRSRVFQTRDLVEVAARDVYNSARFRMQRIRGRRNESDDASFQDSFKVITYTRGTVQSRPRTTVRTIPFFSVRVRRGRPTRASLWGIMALSHSRSSVLLFVGLKKRASRTSSAISSRMRIALIISREKSSSTALSPRCAQHERAFPSSSIIISSPGESHQ